MQKVPKISESEWEIMKLIWENNPITSEEIIELLSSETKWAEKTIKSFLNRLVNKGVIGYKKEGRWYHYYPIVTMEECIEEESENFLERVFGGAVGKLVCNFLEKACLTDEEIENLQKVLKQNQQKHSE